MKKSLLLSALLFICCVSAFAQLNLPRESQRQSISQTIGDTNVSIVYHRPNTKARKVWGGLVPYGEVWRAGANEATVFETSRDVTINGQPLPAGKYSLHAIPAQDEWTIIFNKTADQWGSFRYDAKQDALRVKTKPVKADFQETLSYNFENMTPNTAQVSLRWEQLSIPFTVDVGDLHGRTVAQIREAIKNRKTDDISPYNQGAGYVLTFKVKNSYDEAISWLDEALKARENFGSLNTKARLLAEMGRNADAIATAEKAVQVGKAATPAANTADLEKLIAEWKSKK
jgi:tetratricopeptide (TPR) repeat protein